MVAGASADWRLSESDLHQIRVLAAALETARSGHDPVEEVFDSGELAPDEIEDALKQILEQFDWEKATTVDGATVPPHIKGAPLTVTAREDGFDGKGSLGVTFAPGASGRVRLDVKRLWNDEWLPAIKSKKGERALGDQRVEPHGEAATVKEILFGTNRGGVEEGEFNKARSDKLTFGSVRVSVPTNKKRGRVPRPWSVIGFKMPENARKHIMLVETPEVLERARFVERAKAHCVANEAFLFVHGYNTHFKAGLWRTAQLAHDLEIEGPIFHYAWPSRGSLLGYDYDIESVNQSRPHFKDFIRTIIDDAGITSLNVVAHSKGNALALDVFADLADEVKSRKAKNLVLAAPDVDVDVAKGLLARAVNFFGVVTLYANGYDRPLLVSGAKAMGARAGGLLSDNAPLIVDFVDSIDAATTDFDLFGLNHDAYVDAPVLMYDLLALFKRGVRPPDKRSPTIRSVSCARGVFYQVVTV